jgi:hypothetical protein
MSASLSPAARQLTAALGVVSAVVGAVMFAAPGWSAREFPWNVSEFVAMTIGGWCLGNAWVAWVAIRRWQWASTFAVLVYLWAFSTLEVLVLVWFRERLRVEGLLTGPYLVMLGLGLLAALRGVSEAAAQGGAPPMADARPATRAVRNAVVAFVVFVGFLGVFGLFATEFGASRRVFPEPLSPFTLRAFAVFYLALAMGALALLWAPSLEAVLTYGRAGLGLIAPITAAAFVYIGRFDFSEHPGQAAYIGAYLLVAVAVVAVLAAARIRARRGG